MFVSALNLWRSPPPPSRAGQKYYERIAARLRIYFKDDADPALFGPSSCTPRTTTQTSSQSSSAAPTASELSGWRPRRTPPESRWVNWWLSAHTPAHAAAQKSPGIHMMDIYRAEIAPEFFTKRAPLFYIDIASIQNEVASAWGAEQTGPVNSSVEKLLKKGAYLPTSIRYGEGQIVKRKRRRPGGTRCPRHRALGTASLYAFDNDVRPFKEHIELNAQTTAQLAEKLCANKTSRQLYQVICRFLVAATTSFLPLYASASRSPNLLAHIKKTMAGDTIYPAKPSYSTEHMWSSLCKAIRIRTKIPADILAALGPAEIQRIAAVMGGTAVAGRSSTQGS